MMAFEYLKKNIEDMQKFMIALPLRKFETKGLLHSLRMSKIREYKHGQVIMKEDDEDSCIHFLLFGKTRLEKEGKEIRIIENPGEIFGDVKMLGDLAQGGTLYAEGEAICLSPNTYPGSIRVTSDEGADMLLLLYRVFMEYTAIRLRLLTEELVKTKMEIERLDALSAKA